jgi:hypothetical protein
MTTQTSGSYTVYQVRGRRNQVAVATGFATRQEADAEAYRRAVAAQSEGNSRVEFVSVWEEN